jgi:hypothetical protein
MARKKIPHRAVELMMTFVPGVVAGVVAMVIADHLL